METTIRPARATDAAECGRIIYAAFTEIADRHGFSRPFPSPEVATGLATMRLTNPGFYGVVAEEARNIVGSNFVYLRSPVAGISPITVDPAAQNRRIGRTLMQAVMDHATAQRKPSIRLVQATYNNGSLCLYTTLGFQTKAPLSVMNGSPLNLHFPGYDVRRATMADLAACNRICHAVHGFDRGDELRDAIAASTATVVEHLGRVTGYATGIAFFAHAVGETNQDLKALIGAARVFAGPGFLVPTQNYDLFAWCLANGLRLVMPMTLMSMTLLRTQRSLASLHCLLSVCFEAGLETCEWTLARGAGARLIRRSRRSCGERCRSALCLEPRRASAQELCAASKGLQGRTRRVSATIPETTALALPDKPSIAVLPSPTRSRIFR
jgi:L-amino acid N-acyltransferase YncA